MMRAKDFRAAAWQKLSGCWFTAVVCALLYSVLVSALGGTVIGVILLGGPLWVGFNWFCLDQMRGQKPSIVALFDPLQHAFGQSVVAYLLVHIFTFLWSLLLVIPGIIKTYSYAMVPYILGDNPTMGVTEAIDESRRLMDGNKWRLFCLDFSFIGWALLSIITFGIAGFFFMPYISCAKAEFYLSIKNK